MAKQSKPSRTVAFSPSVTTEQGLDLINILIKKATAMFSGQQLDQETMSGWETLAENYLVKVFGSDSPNIEAVVHAPALTSLHMGMSEHEWDQYRKGIMKSRLKVLENLSEVLQTEIQLQRGSAAKAPHQLGEKVFIVHGHDLNTLDQIARFADKLELEKIILQELPNKGRTIIEKFEEECRGVGFAIVLMTGDDRGAVKDLPFENQRLRARQNVVLELGFFLGRLGRNRVAVVYEDDIEIPSDYSGVLFVKLESTGSWKLQVAKELKAAGFPIDMNKAL